MYILRVVYDTKSRLLQTKRRLITAVPLPLANDFAHSKPRNAGLRRTYFPFGTVAPRRASASCPAVSHHTTALFGRQKRLLFRFFAKLSHSADYIGRSGESQGQGGRMFSFAHTYLLFFRWCGIICATENIIHGCMVYIRQSNQDISRNISISLFVSKILCLRHM